MKEEICGYILGICILVLFSYLFPYLSISLIAAGAIMLLNHLIRNGTKNIY